MASTWIPSPTLLAITLPAPAEVPPTVSPPPVRSMPSAAFPSGAAPEAVVPMKFPSKTLPPGARSSTVMPPLVFPEITLAAARRVPPTWLFSPCTSIPTLFGRATVPVRSVPMSLPWMTS